MVFASMLLILASSALSQDDVNNFIVSIQNSSTAPPVDLPVVNTSENAQSWKSTNISTDKSTNISTDKSANTTQSQSGTITLDVIPKPQPRIGWLITASIIILGLIVYWLVYRMILR